MGFSEEPGVLAVRQVAAGGSHRLGEDHMGRQITAAALQVGGDAAGVRRVDSTGEQAARLHHLVTGVVNRRGGVVAAADDRELVAVLGVTRQNLADRKPAASHRDRLERAPDLGG